MSRTTLPLLPIISLVIFSLPLIILATFTTVLAFSALAIRVSLVYLEMGIALLKSAISSPASSGTSISKSKKRLDGNGRLGTGAGKGFVQKQRGMGGPWSAVD